MAFGKSPQTHITGLDTVQGTDTVAGTTADKYLLVPLTSIPQLTEAECDVTTGDIRKVVFALQEALYQAYAAMEVADIPTNWKAYRSPGTENNAGYATRSYTNQFEILVSAVEVKDE